MAAKSTAWATGLTLCAIAFIFAPASRAAAGEVEDAAFEQLRKRQEQEAKDLFRTVLSELGRKPQRCELSHQWHSDIPVPYNVAHRFLGHAIYGELAAPQYVAEPAKIFDLPGELSGSLCTDQELEGERASRDKEFGENKDAIKSERSVMHSLSYAFPIFDRNFRTAIIMGWPSRETWYVNDKGQVRRRSESQIIQRIYRKRNGRWRLLEAAVLPGN